MARPKSEKYNISKMIEEINKYTELTEIPILKEVCYMNDWLYDTVNDLMNKHDELFHAIKKLLMKKEVVLETGALKGKYDKTMAIFSLKQLGWRDKQEVELEDNRKVEIIYDLPR